MRWGGEATSARSVRKGILETIAKCNCVCNHGMMQMFVFEAVLLADVMMAILAIPSKWVVDVNPALAVAGLVTGGLANV